MFSILMSSILPWFTSSSKTAKHLDICVTDKSIACSATSSSLVVVDCRENKGDNNLPPMLRTALSCQEGIPIFAALALAALRRACRTDKAILGAVWLISSAIIKTKSLCSISIKLGGLFAESNCVCCAATFISSSL